MLTSSNRGIYYHIAIKDESPLHQAIFNIDLNLTSPSTIYRFEKSIPLSVYFETKKHLLKGLFNHTSKHPMR